MFNITSNLSILLNNSLNFYIDLWSQNPYGMRWAWIEQNALPNFMQNIRDHTTIARRESYIICFCNYTNILFKHAFGVVVSRKIISHRTTHTITYSQNLNGPKSHMKIAHTFKLTNTVLWKCYMHKRPPCSYQYKLYMHQLEQT